MYLNIRISSVSTVSHDQLRMGLTSRLDSNLKRRLIGGHDRNFSDIQRSILISVSMPPKKPQSKA